MPDFANEFSWSHSRHRRFNRCPREYFYNHYGSWGGWERSAAPALRELYIMKNLSALPLWIGKRVHLIAHQAVQGLPYGHRTEAGQMLALFYRKLRADWQGSERDAYRSDPKKILGLREHYYNLQVTAETKKAYYTNGCECIRNLYDTDVYGQLAFAPRVRILEMETMHDIDVDGVKVWVVPDLIFQMEPGTVDIVDWKTGRSTASAATQLGIYALYAQRTLGIAPEKITIHTVALAGGSEDVQKVSQEMLDTTASHIRSSADAMRAALVDPAQNIARIEDFPRTEAAGTCNYCNYLAACGREQEEAGSSEVVSFEPEEW